MSCFVFVRAASSDPAPSLIFPLPSYPIFSTYGEPSLSTSVVGPYGERRASACLIYSHKTHTHPHTLSLSTFLVLQVAHQSVCCRLLLLTLQLQRCFRCFPSLTVSLNSISSIHTSKTWRRNSSALQQPSQDLKGFKELIIKAD